jgi:hypothetical protein
MKQGWDNAVRAHLGMNRVEELEEAWLNWMRGVYRPNDALLAKTTKPAPAASLSQPVVRGASPDEPAAPPLRGEGWSPTAGQPPRRSAVRLMPPEPDNWIPPAQQAVQHLPR